jgi:hypothetical protein
MTANRIVINGELRPHGRTVEIIVKPRWTHADLDAAESLQGAPVRITIESAPAHEQAAPEPETPAPMPDRDALGRAVHAAWLDLRESNFGKRPSLAWDDLEDDLQELDRCVGERIFNMGALHGKQIEPADRAPAPTIEPLTGGPADINVRVLIKCDVDDVSFLAGEIGTLMRYSTYGLADIRLDNGNYYAVHRDHIERAPAECPHCCASQVTR